MKFSHLLVFVIVRLITGSLALADPHSMKVIHPPYGSLGIVNDDMLIFTSHSQLGWTVSYNQGLRLLCRPISPETKRTPNHRYLGIDQSGEAPRLILESTESKESPWKWHLVRRTGGESRIVNLEIANGKFKGLYLAVDEESSEFPQQNVTRKDEPGRLRPEKTNALKFVEKPDHAIQFHTWPLSK